MLTENAWGLSGLRRKKALRSRCSVSDCCHFTFGPLSCPFKSTRRKDSCFRHTRCYASMPQWRYISSVVGWRSSLSRQPTLLIKYVSSFLPCLSALTKPYNQASRSSIFRLFTTSVVLFSILISASRILALWYYYHAPLSLVYSLESQELPRLLNDSGLLPTPSRPVSKQRGETRETRIDLSPIKGFDLTLCIGKEWYRFPGHYLVPTGVRVDFVNSEFRGLLPGHFSENQINSSFIWPRPQTRFTPRTMNDLNLEQPAHYVRKSCSILTLHLH